MACSKYIANVRELISFPLPPFISFFYLYLRPISLPAFLPSLLPSSLPSNMLFSKLAFFIFSPVSTLKNTSLLYFFNILMVCTIITFFKLWLYYHSDCANFPSPHSALFDFFQLTLSYQITVSVNVEMVSKEMIFHLNEVLGTLRQIISRLNFLMLTYFNHQLPFFKGIFKSSLYSHLIIFQILAPQIGLKVSVTNQES